MQKPSPWQPRLEGELLILRPLRETDFDALFAAAADPAIWAMHPEPDRHTRDKFRLYFETGLASHGALVVEEKGTGAVIGSSRFADHDPETRSVEIGYTFLVRRCWGQGHNREMKALMLHHAFQIVDSVLFYVGERNLISRRAVEKLGAGLLRAEDTLGLDDRPCCSMVYELRAPESRAHRSSGLTTSKESEP